MRKRIVHIAEKNLNNFVISLDFCVRISYNIYSDRDITITGQDEKGGNMDEEMNVGELLKEVAEENQTRKILEILENCKDLEEAKKKVKALLNK